MTTEAIRRLVHKIDHVIRALIGANKDSQKKLIIPRQFTATELRRIFVRDYVKAQPSFLQATLLTLYVNLVHFIGSVAKRTFRRSKG